VKIAEYRDRLTTVLETYLHLLQRQEPLIRGSDLSVLQETMVREAELVREIEALDGALRTLRAAAGEDRASSTPRGAGVGGSEVSPPGARHSSRGGDSSVPDGDASAPAGTSSVPAEEPGSDLWRAILDQHATNRALLAERRREVGERISEVRVPRGARSVYRQRDTGSRIDVTR
jgi:hypothetical protein